MQVWSDTELTRIAIERWQNRGKKTPEEAREQKRATATAYRKGKLGRTCKYCGRPDGEISFYGWLCANCSQQKTRYGICEVCERPHSRFKRRGKSLQECYDTPAGLAIDRPSVEWQRERVEREIQALPREERLEHEAWLYESRQKHERLLASEIGLKLRYPLKPQLFAVFAAQLAQIAYKRAEG